MSGETVAGAALAATVFCMVLGSSSVHDLVGPGRKLRWLALLVLAAVAVVLAWRSRGVRPGRPLLVVAALGGWIAALGLVSTAWSVDPRLTFGRAASFAVLVALASALAYASLDRPQLPSRLLFGVLAGTVLVSLGGFAMLAVAHGDAVQPASASFPARFRGLGENPDTVSMLEGLVSPIALWALLRAGRTRDRLVALGVVVLLVASISASGSRGGLLAMVAGGVVYGLSLRVAIRRRLVVVVAVCLAAFAATAGTQIPKPLASAPATVVGPAGSTGAAGQPSISAPSPKVVERRYTGRLTDELYRSNSDYRTLFTSSGRFDAWYQGIVQGDTQPILGHGFGTEAAVFVDRISSFQGEYVESSLVGFYIELGAIGLASLVALLAAVGVGSARAVRQSAPGVAGEAAPLAAIVAGGISLVFVQSYVYSVGNIATVAFWTVAFAGAALACAPGRQHAGERNPQEQGAVAAA